jgi:hypothetical protein
MKGPCRAMKMAMTSNQSQLLCAFFSMGAPSRLYAAYFFGMGGVCGLVAVWCMSIVSGPLSTCVKLCPLQTQRSGAACNTDMGYCVATDQCRPSASILDAANSLERLNADGCYVCNGTDVYYPAYRARSERKWHPSPACEAQESGPGRNADNYTLCWSVPLEMSARGSVPALFLLQLVSYILQCLGFMLCGVAMRMFAG